MATSYDSGAMPTNYDSDPTSSSSIVDKEWVTGINGILKAGQIIASVIVLICSTAWPPFASHYGGHWVQFSCIVALIYAILSYYTRAFYIRQKFTMIGLPINFAVTSLIVIICSSTNFPARYGGGWVEFVSITATIAVAVRYALYVFKMPEKLSPKLPFFFVELVSYGVFTFFYFISAVVCSAFGDRSASIGAAAFFTWVAFVLFGIDVYFALGKWRGSGEGPRLGGSGGTGPSSGATGTNPSASSSSNMPADPYGLPGNTPSGAEKGLPPQY